MRSRLEALQVRRREILDHLVLLTDLEKRGRDVAIPRVRWASKLRHVEESIFKLKQKRLPL